jgi:ISXO2-like transposase domain
VNGAKGHSALQLSRDLDVQYKTAFVLAHKLREAVADEAKARKVSGDVWKSTARISDGYVKPANHRENRRDRLINQSGKRRCVVVMRERNGKTLPHISAAPRNCRFRQSKIASQRARHLCRRNFLLGHAARALSDEAHQSHGSVFDGRRLHQSDRSFFSRLRRAEIGMHHHIAGPYLNAYADEMAWREDNRRRSNGELYLAMADAALRHAVSRQWKGYWQRSTN